MRIEVYEPERQEAWDHFVATSKNGLFQHRRGFMEYHQEPFDDQSLLVWDARDRLLAVLPANRRERRIASHEGLTYGGLLCSEATTQALALEIWERLLTELAERGFERLHYRAIPYIHHRAPAQEDLLALFLAEARLVARDVLPVIALGHRLPVSSRRRRGASRARRAEVETAASQDFAGFWTILDGVLEAKGARPVHDLDEIRRLHELFPQNVRLFTATNPDGEIVAGVVIFESRQVARAQYIATSDRGKELGALDLLFTYLLDEVFATKPFFDFGSTTFEGGRRLHASLAAQKEGFGARTVTADRYEVDLSTYSPGTLRRALP